MDVKAVLAERLSCPMPRMVSDIQDVEGMTSLRNLVGGRTDTQANATANYVGRHRPVTGSVQVLVPLVPTVGCDINNGIADHHDGERAFRNHPVDVENPPTGPITRQLWSGCRPVGATVRAANRELPCCTVFLPHAPSVLRSQ